MVDLHLIYRPITKNYTLCNLTGFLRPPHICCPFLRLWFLICHFILIFCSYCSYLLKYILNVSCQNQIWWKGLQLKKCFFATNYSYKKLICIEYFVVLLLLFYCCSGFLLFCKPYLMKAIRYEN